MFLQCNFFQRGAIVYQTRLEPLISCASAFPKLLSLYQRTMPVRIRPFMLSIEEYIEVNFFISLALRAEPRAIRSVG